MTASDDLHFPSHIHRLVTGDDLTASPLVLLHGSGGREQDLMPLAQDLTPKRSILAVRGAIRWDGGFAFFRRFADRSIDEVDLRKNATELASFTEGVRVKCGFGKPPIAVGFSNGAIMASALLLMRPSMFGGAILLRPLSPFLDELQSEISGTPVLVIDGELDTRRSPGDGDRLAERLRQAGARVEHHTLPIGHAITAQDSQIARKWIERSL